MVEHSFWWTAIGVGAFYLALLVFGGVEGYFWLHDPVRVQAIHRWYGPVISAASSALALGFWIYFANVYLTIRKR